MALPDWDFAFTSRTPDPPLDRFVASLWHARGTVPYVRERIAPTGSTVAVFVLGDPIVETPDDGAGEALHAARGFLLGPHDRPVVNEPTGETHAVGIVTTPVGCEAVLGLRPASLRGRALDLLDAWPPAADLRARLLAEDGIGARLDLLEVHLRGAADPGVAALDRCERAVALLEEDPTAPITAIAAAVAVSTSQLTRDLTRVVGLTPRVLARLLRMRRLLAGLDPSDEVAWAALAADLGWFDQSHLIRDVKRHTGVTPSEYVAAQRTWLRGDPAEAAGFVPEG